MGRGRRGRFDVLRVLTFFLSLLEVVGLELQIPDSQSRQALCEDVLLSPPTRPLVDKRGPHVTVPSYCTTTCRTPLIRLHRPHETPSIVVDSSPASAPHLSSPATVKLSPRRSRLRAGFCVLGRPQAATVVVSDAAATRQTHFALHGSTSDCRELYMLAVVDTRALRMKQSASVIVRVADRKREQV